MGAISNFLSGGNEKKAINAAKQGVKAFNNLSTPDVQQMQLQLEELVNAGEITPEEAKVYLQQKSAANNISVDPRFNTAQMAALDQLSDIGENGLTDVDRAALAKIKTEEDANLRGEREAILSDAQARGVGGSGIELMNQLQNAQDNATRASARDTDVAGMSQQRKLDAIKAAGGLAGNMADRSFGQQMDVARANDAIDQFNTSNRNSIGLANTNARNAAQAANLANAQRIYDTNVGLRNEAQKNNKSLAQLDYENRLKKAQGIAGAQGALSGAYGQAGANNMNLTGSLIQGGATLGAGALKGSDRNFKKNIEEFDADEFLNGLTSVKFNYKNPQKHGEGKQVGLIAQDMEKVAPDAVIEKEDGKYIDYSKLGGRILASLVSVNDRLHKVENKK